MTESNWFNEKKMDAEVELWHKKSLRQYSRWKRWKDMFALKLFTITDWMGVAFFASLALPSLMPSSYVKLYYSFKIIFECFIIGLCLYHTGSIESTDDVLDLLHILRTQVFTDIWLYWSIGTVSFICGGLLSYFFVIDAYKWKEILEPTDVCLLKRMNAKQYDYVDRVIGNRVCTVGDIIQRTLERKDPNCLTREDCCRLLCQLLRCGVVTLGPKYANAKKGKVKSSKYENNIVSALLSNFDWGPSTCNSKESRLAKLVFRTLINQANSNLSVSHVDIRAAGASLTFLRFHLKTPIAFFDKSGDFNCTAVELYRAKFDLLFCLKCNFSPGELIDAGFREKHVRHPVFDDLKNCELKQLEQFGRELFEMKFYVKQLREAFPDIVVLKWFQNYRLNLQPCELGSSRSRVSHKFGRQKTEPLYKKALVKTDSRRSTNPERLRRDFRIDYNFDGKCCSGIAL